MLPRLVFAALFLCALASRPEASIGKRRAPAVERAGQAEAPSPRAAPPLP